MCLRKEVALTLTSFPRNLCATRHPMLGLSSFFPCTFSQHVSTCFNDLFKDLEWMCLCHLCLIIEAYIQSLGIQSPSQMVIVVYNHLLRKVLKFHYHSQKVIGSLGSICFNIFLSRVFFRKKTRVPAR